MGSIFVTELICPECGTPFNGLPTDRIFTCRKCRYTVQINSGKRKKLTLNVADAGDFTGKPLIYLPFWNIPVQVEMTNPEGDKVDISMMHLPQNVWVGAFLEMHAAYMGNPGMDMTKSGIKVDPGSELPPESLLQGGARTINSAGKYARIFMTDIIDSQRDISGFSINIKTGVYRYFAIPFVFNEVDFTLTNTAFSKTYKAIVVEEIRQILKMQGLA
jgi:hypothetical protein